MFYLCEGEWGSPNWERGKFCITDTTDFSEEYYSKEEVEHMLSLGITIYDTDIMYNTEEATRNRLAKLALLGKKYNDYHFRLSVDKRCIQFDVQSSGVGRNEIVVPHGVDYLNSMADRSVKSLVLSDSVRAITYDGVAPTNSIESIRFPNRPYRIEKGAFKSSYGLKALDLSNCYHIGHSAFYNCLWLVSVILPKNLDIIHCGTFRNCTRLCKINIPSSVKYIDDYAFVGTNLPVVFLPKGVEKVKITAFDKSTKIYAYKDTIFISSNGISGYDIVWYNNEKQARKLFENDSRWWVG